MNCICELYLNKVVFFKKSYTPMFIAALIIIDQKWKQPKYPSAEEWINKKWYIYTIKYYAVIKKEWTTDTGYYMMNLPQKHYGK